MQIRRVLYIYIIQKYRKYVIWNLFLLTPVHIFLYPMGYDVRFSIELWKTWLLQLLELYIKIPNWKNPGVSTSSRNQSKYNMNYSSIKVRLTFPWQRAYLLAIVMSPIPLSRNSSQPPWVICLTSHLLFHQGHPICGNTSSVRAQKA